MFTRSRMMQAAGNAGGPVEIALTISGDTHNYNIYSNRGGTYEAGNSIITLTINSGIYVGSTSTGTYALTIPSDFHADDEIIIINNGVIIGMGANGGTGGTGQNGNTASAGQAGGAGGDAILAQHAVTITNNGTVAGGGGGGGGSGNTRYCSGYFYGSCTSYNTYRGSGGGGGAGYNAGGGGGTSGGGSGNLIGNGGSSGSKTAGGSGGNNNNGSHSPGGTGGGPGASGSTGGANYGGGGAGGAPGDYVNGNSNITWAVTGTRLGGVS